MSRHRQKHLEGLDRKLVEVPPPLEEASFDHLEEAQRLLAQATTERQRLKGLESIRASTSLILRAIGEPGAEELELLDANLDAAEAAYRSAGGGFEVASRALGGVRAAVAQKLEVLRNQAGGIPTRMVFSMVGYRADGSVDPRPVTSTTSNTFMVTPEVHFRGVPKRFRDVQRFSVDRRIRLR